MIASLSASVVLLSGCRFFGGEQPTRTPIPTYTPTPILVVIPAGAVDAAAAGNQGTTADTSQALPQGQNAQPVVVNTLPPTDTPSPVPTNTVPPTPTPQPTSTQTPTPAPTSTPSPTYTPTPIPAPAYAFTLETAERFPTDSLAPDVVRIWLYVYAPGQFGLADYGLRITRDGVLLDSESLSEAGLPQVTRAGPGPYSRFTNMSIIVVEADGGEWEIQLVDSDGRPVGPPANFAVNEGDEERELYVRYRQGSE